MPRKPRQSVALAQRRAQVGDLYLQSWTQTAIADRLAIAQSTVCADLKAIQQSWRDSAIRDFDQARLIELQKLDRIEREAWAAWERSQKPEQAARISGQGTGERSVKFIRNQTGDPRFLEQIQKCIAQRRVLLQLDQPAASPEPEQIHRGHLSLDDRRARLLAWIDVMRERQITGQGKAASDAGDSGRDCIDCLSNEVGGGPAPDPPRLGHA
jgi:hypothetical protein